MCLTEVKKDMKFNSGNHWVEDMDENETILITLESIEQTKAGNPYIIAKHDTDTIYANIARWDENKLQPGHNYKMTCTKKQYNQNSKRNYMYYSFDEISSRHELSESEIAKMYGQSPTEKEKQVTLADYDYGFEGLDFEPTDEQQLSVEVLESIRDDYERQLGEIKQRLGAVNYALEKLCRGEEQ